MDTNHVIPDRKTCFEIMSRFHMPRNIREHSIVVCEVAVALAKELNSKGEKLNLQEIEAAALLHDLTKVNSIDTKENHAETAATLLRDLGYERVAQIVNEHVIISRMGKDGNLTEEEIVNYADKRVRHYTVVPLQQRYNDLMKRYGTSPESVQFIKKLKTKTRAIEKMIFSRINLSPDALPSLLAKYSFK